MRGLLFLALVGCSRELVEPEVPLVPPDVLSLVDPFIGTGGDGAEIANVNPGASMPFGTTLTGPDTRGAWGAISFYHCAGYWYPDDKIMGFSHMHAHGMGVTDYQMIQYLPRDGWDPSYTDRALRAAPFNHEDEWARAGSYGVTLQDTGTEVSIAATTRGAQSVIRWQEGAEPVIVMDLGFAADGGEVFEADATWAPGESRVTGYQRMGGSYTRRSGGQREWFIAEFDPAPIHGGAWDDPSAPVAGATQATGPLSGIWLTFPEGTTEVTMSVALSSTGPEGAERNFEAELAGKSWDGLVGEAEEAWETLLGRVRAWGGTEREQRIFYTALYHAALMPSRHDDVDGQYRGLDDAVHQADHAYYSDLSLWDTFRTLHPWYVLAWPEVQLDINRSLVRMATDGGTLPKWPIGHGYSGGMVGSPATQVLAGSWLKGLTDFDAEAGFDAALAVSSGRMPNAGRGGIDGYLEHGFVGLEDAGGSVSRTLEYAWSDHSLALWGDALGKDVAAVQDRSENWRNLWYAEEGFFTGRCGEPDDPRCMEDGLPDDFYWSEVRDPDLLWEGHFIEGNSWHYVWYVPYDVSAMIEVQHDGDTDAFLERYENYWREGVFKEPDDLISDDYYWHGNEPVMHYAFLGALAGAPDITSDAARWVLENRYDDQPVGLDGNDDSGTLSAWYLLASTGLFPIAGTTQYVATPPLFSRVEIDRPDGTVWTMTAPNTSAEARYIDEVRVGGEAVAGATFEHADVWAGGLHYELSE